MHTRWIDRHTQRCRWFPFSFVSFLCPLAGFALSPTIGLELPPTAPLYIASASVKPSGLVVQVKGGQGAVKLHAVFRWGVEE